MKIKIKQELFTSNFSLKIISLLIALFLWVYVLNMQNPRDTREIKVPIYFTNLANLKSKNLKYMGAVKFNAVIKIEARRLRLNSISSSDFGVKADFKDLNKEGVNIVPIELYKTPEDVNIMQITPQSLKVSLVKIK
jgi:YbbR domain-containing protein